MEITVDHCPKLPIIKILRGGEEELWEFREEKTSPWGDDRKFLGVGGI